MFFVFFDLSALLHVGLANMGEAHIGEARVGQTHIGQTLNMGKAPYGQRSTWARVCLIGHAFFKKLVLGMTCQI